ncbi:AAA family ATPase [Tardiphaga sp. 20_F10_N6_6]|uniref:AAA family ATPase n=1 Tax=Tardiphaga sp. 20_F10_N6_6 TaxID=3240788 RepID=UPI003F8C2552
MGVLNIRKAERAGARLVIGIAGVSGSGKTYSALQLAWGLAKGDANKVGLLDTENRRGSLYADILVGKDKKVHPFLIGDLDAPFSPQRYIDAILEFQAAGVEVLVIDSVSHEWNGLGGVLSIVDGYEKPITGWKKGKPEHKRFMNMMLQSDMHIIVCIRASNKTDWKDPKNPRTLGITPVQHEEFMFEMTASMMMWDGGKQREVMKCPQDLVPIFGENGGIAEGYLTAKHGLQLRAWVDGAASLDPKVENARNTLRSIAEQGVAALNKQWGKVPADVREALGGIIPDEIKSAAEAFDRQRTQAQPGGEELADLNKEVLGDAANTEAA